MEETTSAHYSQPISGQGPGIHSLSRLQKYRRTSGTSKEAKHNSLPRNSRLIACKQEQWRTHLDGRFTGDVGDQEVHGDILAVNILIHHVPDRLRHHVGV